MLASSLWPRTGGGSANTAHLSCEGPTAARVRDRFTLAPDAGAGGGVVASDGSLRITCGTEILAVDLSRGVTWRVDPDTLARESLRRPPPKPGARIRVSLPCALAGGSTTLAVGAMAVVLDAAGAVVQAHSIKLLDDTGASPNVDADGGLLFTTMDGTIVCLGQDTRIEISGFGYDLVPVALYADGTLGVPAYNQYGFSRVSADGRILWSSGFTDTDMIPSVDPEGFAAVASKNQRRSAIIDPDGQIVATIPGASVFSCRPGGWVGINNECLVAVDGSGSVQWSRPITTDARWGINQAIVDAAGRIYVSEQHRILALDPDGRERFTLSVPLPPGPLFAVAEGMMGFVAGGQLWLIG